MIAAAKLDLAKTVQKQARSMCEGPRFWLHIGGSSKPWLRDRADAPPAGKIDQKRGTASTNVLASLFSNSTSLRAARGLMVYRRDGVYVPSNVNDDNEFPPSSAAGICICPSLCSGAMVVVADEG